MPHINSLANLKRGRFRPPRPEGLRPIAVAVSPALWQQARELHIIPTDVCRRALTRLGRMHIFAPSDGAPRRYKAHGAIPRAIQVRATVYLTVCDAPMAARREACELALADAIISRHALMEKTHAKA